MILIIFINYISGCFIKPLLVSGSPGKQILRDSSTPD